MTAVDKSASDKANLTGEARAAKLIAWFNAGAGGRIRWGTPGDFDACVRIAGKHMRPDQAKGFCALRHKDATGHRPGQAPAERKVHKAGRLAVLRRLLSLHPAAKADCPSCGEEVSVFAGKCTSCGTALSVEAKKDLGTKTSAMVALYPDADTARAMALNGGELPEALHVTLGFLGSDAVVRLDRDKIEGALAAFAAANAPVSGEVGGLGRFQSTDDDGWPLVALIDAPGLTEFRQRLVGALSAAGVDVASNHGYTAHCTLAYVTPADEAAASSILADGVPATPLHFGSVVLAWGDDRTVFRLTGAAAAPRPVVKAVAGPVIKSDDAKRYTFAPLYPASPETPATADLDAHGDFATADDLQKAVWDYVRAGDRTIRDQHRDGTTIGETVEIVSWPYAVTVPMTLADGSMVQKSFAAGTVFMGVVWNEAGWSDVVKGAKTGYSLGGMATRVSVEASA